MLFINFYCMDENMTDSCLTNMLHKCSFMQHTRHGMFHSPDGKRDGMSMTSGYEMMTSCLLFVLRMPFAIKCI